MLARTLDLLTAARQAPSRHGILAMNVIGLDHAQAIVDGAEAERSPIILQVSENTVRYWRGALSPIAAACRELAIGASVPVAVHLDHATGREICEDAVRSGISSIMFDASAASWDDNVRQTASIVAWAHARDLAVEGEVGIVGGKNGVRSGIDGYTDPDDAFAFVAQTGIDALAIAVGTEHGMSKQEAHLDLDRIDRIFAMVDIPLVLHGSSGVPADVLDDAVRRGITKVNVATQLNVAYTRAIRDALARDTTMTDPRAYGRAGRDAMVEVVRAYCRIVRSSGTAPEPWYGSP